MARKLNGKEVVPSHRRLRINITQADIDKGEVLNPNACAAAQAIQRALKKQAKVHRGVTYLDEGKAYRKYRTSTALRMETIIFDRGGRFMPGPYDLLDVPIRELGYGSTTKKKPKPSGRSRAPAKRRNIPGVRHTARSATAEDE